MRFSVALILLLLVCGCIKSPPDDITTTTTMKMNEIVVFETSKGVIEVELYRDKAPITVENFMTYVTEGYYNGTVFHRVIDGFMIQGGGFTPDGMQKQTHAPIKLESGNGLGNVKGSVTMARTTIPDSATSQFFINVIDNDFLNYKPNNPGYAVFGKVAYGMDVIEGISKVKTKNRGSHQNWPLEDIIIEKAYVKG